MLRINPADMIEWDGFEMYDAETGKRMSPHEISEREFSEDRRLPQIVNGFCLTWEGFLYLTCEDERMVYVPRHGKYLVQINGEKYVRW